MRFLVEAPQLTLHNLKNIPLEQKKLIYLLCLFSIKHNEKHKMFQILNNLNKINQLYLNINLSGAPPPKVVFFPGFFLAAEACQGTC